MNGFKRKRCMEQFSKFYWRNGSNAEAMDLDNLPDPDFYLRRERIRQLYTELYKEKNITKFRNTKISIERKVAA